MNINSKSDWKILKENYLETKQVYLCHAWVPFLTLWQDLDNRNYLRNQASLFLESIPSHSVRFEVLLSDSLFAESSTYKGLFYNSMRRSVRLAFLDWMIKNSIDDTTTI